MYKSSTEKFQVIYIDTAPQGDGMWLPLLKCRICIITFFQKYSIESGGGESNFTSQPQPGDQSVLY